MDETHHSHVCDLGITETTELGAAFRNQRESQSRGRTHGAVLLVADFGQVRPSDHAQSRRQTLQQQADDGGAQQHPEELRGGAAAHR